jgi:hypothetical protein
MSRAWIAAGADPKRVSLNYSSWTEGEILYLQDYVGTKLLREIANDLRRSYPAVRRKLYDLRITSRGNQGFFSAALVAQEYNCSYHRLLKLLKNGEIPGRMSKKRHRWLIDLGDITPEMKEILKQPKQTHKAEPVDIGDWDKRNNIHRHRIGDRVVRVREPVVI